MGDYIFKNPKIGTKVHLNLIYLFISNKVFDIKSLQFLTTLVKQANILHTCCSHFNKFVCIIVDFSIDVNHFGLQVVL